MDRDGQEVEIEVAIRPEAEKDALAERAVAMVVASGPVPAPNIGTPAPFVGEPTFRLILDMIDQQDEGIEQPFTPEALGQLERDKVDAIYHVMIELDRRAAEMRGAAEPFLAAAAMLEDGAQRWEKHKARLEAYVTYEMERHNHRRLPGNVFKLSRFINNPTCITGKKRCGPDEYLEFGEDYVSTDTTYQWDKVALKKKGLEREAVEAEIAELVKTTVAGAPGMTTDDARSVVLEQFSELRDRLEALAPFAFVSLTRGQRIEFEANKPEKPAKKKEKK